MSQLLLLHRVERMLADATERLADEFPSLPIGVITRCVEAARIATPASRPTDLAEVAATVERTARDDLARIAAALVDRDRPAVLR